MEEQTVRFLGESNLSRIVKLAGATIVHRTSMSPIEVAELRTKKEYELAAEKNIVELELGGVVVAHGKLVTKGKNTYFKVWETFPSSHSKEESR
jgi:hypothetical protein